jgi:leader peptidase (prepilin peptidase)/N-methyltransferase
MSELALTAVAALWGAAAGLFVPRAAYRFAVEPDETWRDSCPAGHTITGPAKGWLGFARCGACTAGEPPVRDASAGAAPGDAVREDSAGAAPGDPVREDSAGAAPGDAERAASASVPSYGPASVPSYGPSTPLVSLAIALLCAALALATGTRPELGVWLLLAPLGVLLAVVDFKVQRLPDALTLSLAAAALALLGVAAAVPEHAGDWLTALFGALALGGAYFVLFLINPNGMGFGDVKLVLGLGAVLGWYGWSVVFLGTFAGFLFGALYGAGLVVARRAGRKTSIPFGPFLIAGAYAGLLIGAYAA